MGQRHTDSSDLCPKVLLGSRWLKCSLWGVQDAAPGCTGVSGWFLPPASTADAYSFYQGLRASSTDMGVYESHEQTAAAPEFTSENSPVQMHQVTRPVSQAQTCALVIRKRDGHNTATKCCEAEHEGILATGRGPLTNSVTSFPTLQQFSGFFSILEQHLYIGKEDFLQAFLYLSLENTEQSNKTEHHQCKESLQLYCII